MLSARHRFTSPYSPDELSIMTVDPASWGLAAILWLLAVLTVITAIQRIVHVRGQDRADAPAPVEGLPS